MYKVAYIHIYICTYIPIAAVRTPPPLSRRRMIVPTVADGFPRAFTVYNPQPRDEQRLRLSEVGFFYYFIIIPFALFMKYKKNQSHEKRLLQHINTPKTEILWPRNLRTCHYRWKGGGRCTKTRMRKKMNCIYMRLCLLTVWVTARDVGAATTSHMVCRLLAYGHKSFSGHAAIKKKTDPKFRTAPEAFGQLLKKTSADINTYTKCYTLQLQPQT